jgi:hypothetical protein
MATCLTKGCKKDAKITWTFRDGSKGHYCPSDSRKISEEINRHAEEMAKFKPSGMPELRE